MKFLILLILLLATGMDGCTMVSYSHKLADGEEISATTLAWINKSDVEGLKYATDGKGGRTAEIGKAGTDSQAFGQVLLTLINALIKSGAVPAVPAP
jgi:hypothetical protein